MADALAYPESVSCLSWAVVGRRCGTLVLFDASGVVELFNGGSFAPASSDEDEDKAPADRF